MRLSIHTHRLLIAGTVLTILTGCALGPSLSRRTAWLAAHPTVEQPYRGAIKHGEIMLGMTKAEVRAAWGDPCGWCYGTTHNSWGDSWEYNVFGTGSMGAGTGTIIYFDADGNVSAISGP